MLKQVLEKLAALKAASPFVLDHIEYVWVERTYIRKREQDEFKLLSRLRMAVLMSDAKHDDDALNADPRVTKRLAELLDHVRLHAPTLKFHERYTRRATEVVPGIYLHANFSCTDARLYRKRTGNITLLRA